MAKVVLENIYKSFPNRTGKSIATSTASGEKKEEKSSHISVLRSIELAIADGEFMVLVGPSGCGKSTLLRIIAGLEESTGGNIWVGDRLVNHLPPKERDIAMVFQNYALYPHLSVYDNIAFGLRRMSKGMGKGTKRSDWIEDILVKITRNLPRKISLSYSQRKSNRRTSAEGSTTVANRRISQSLAQTTFWRTKTTGCFRTGDRSQSASLLDGRTSI